MSGHRIIGVGIDLVDTARLAGAVERHGARFLERVFTEAELEYCDGRIPQLAARFAAKEAVAKAFGTGIGEAMGFREIEVTRNVRGAPDVTLHGTAATTAARLGSIDIFISLTHTEQCAAAHVLVALRLDDPDSVPPPAG